jgi:hypothetical protein
MAYWEFLLQKEGDRDWLPLETAHVEILEGRYRIMAHTSHRDTAVQVQVTQRLDAHPGKPRCLRRQSRTNGEGLMAVMPFTQLTAGHWLVQCQGGTDWAYGVDLHVLPVTIDPDNWAPDWDLPDLAQALPEMPALAHLRSDPAAPTEDSPVPADPLSTHASASGPPASPVEAIAEPEASEPVPQKTPTEAVAAMPPGVTDAFPVATAAPAAAIAPDVEAPSTPAPPVMETAALTALPLRLRLDQQAMVARQGLPVVLQGQVEAVAVAAPQLPLGADLWVQWRNPETGSVVGTCGRSLAISTYPTPFTLTAPLPDVADTRLLVGEMALWQGGDTPQLQAIQGFTVTVNLDSLLEVVANQGEQTSLDPFEAVPPAPASPAPEGPRKALQEPRPREVPFQLIYLPSTGLTLPPQIHRSSPWVPRPVDLPALPNQPRRPTPSPSQDGAPETTPPQRPLTLPPLGATNPTTHPASPSAVPSAPIPAVDLPPLAAPQEGRRPAPGDPPRLDDGEAGSIETDPAAAALPGLPADPNFQALNLKDRFWSRLSALAQEGHDTAASLKLEMQAAGVEPPTEEPPNPALPEPAESSSPPLAAVVAAPPSDLHEVVVYDDAPPPAVETLGADAPATPPSALAPEEDVPSVPLPQFELPAGDLIAGMPMTVGFRLPRSPRRLAVKFWMTDIHSRTLLEKPRWLMQWSPTDGEHQEALLQLQVPMGCLEARFEAIAIDLTNQQESHKVAQSRTIIPPNLVGQYDDEEV